MGRISVDIYPTQVGIGLERVTSFGKFLGGSSSNVAVAAARHGRTAATITRTGDDPFGRYLRAELRALGVDDRQVSAVPGLMTPVTFCEIFPPDDFPLYFYGRSPAPDMQIRPDELDFDAIGQADVFWVTATGLAEEPTRSATLAALEARDRRGMTVLDLDYRPMFWPSRDAARDQIRNALPFATVAVGNLDECLTAVGTDQPRSAVAALHDAGVATAVIKQGPNGVLASDGEHIHDVPPTPVEVVNGLGAGDAFGGALCHGLLSNWTLDRTVRFAGTAGAIVASRIACSSAMPETLEVEALLEGSHDAR